MSFTSVFRWVSIIGSLTPLIGFFLLPVIPHGHATFDGNTEWLIMLTIINTGFNLPPPQSVFTPSPIIVGLILGMILAFVSLLVIFAAINCLLCIGIAAGRLSPGLRPGQLISASLGIGCQLLIVAYVWPVWSSVQWGSIIILLGYGASFANPRPAAASTLAPSTSGS